LKLSNKGKSIRVSGKKNRFLSQNPNLRFSYMIKKMWSKIHSHFRFCSIWVFGVVHSFMAKRSCLYPYDSLLSLYSL